jgi:hypothetical protein
LSEDLVEERHAGKGRPYDSIRDADGER